jgi:hypothetical protein
MFWLLAPIYRLLGADPGAMYASGAIANVVGLCVLMMVARRFGGRRLLAAVGIGATLLVAGAGTVMADPWNPYLTMVPFAVFLIVAAASADGDLVLLPVMLGLGSLLVQTHVGYAVLVAVVGVWTFGLLARRLHHPPNDRPRPTRRRAVSILALCVVVVAAAWVGPLVEQFTTDPGNLTEVVEYFTQSSDVAGGGSLGLGALARQLHPLGPWLGGGERLADETTLDEAGLPWALPALTLLGGAMWWSWRQRDRKPLVLGTTVAISLAAATVASTRITGEPFFYLFRFWWPLAMLLWVTVGWVALRALPMLVARRQLTVATAALMVVVGVGTVANSVELSGELDRLPGAEAVTVVTDAALRKLPPGGTYLVEASGWSYFGELFGVVDRLDAEGFTVVSNPRFVNQFGERRVVGGGEAPTRFDGRLVVATNGSVDVLASEPGWVTLASWDPLSATERAEARTLWDEVMRQFVDAGYPDIAANVGNAPLEKLLENSGVEAETVGISAATRARLDELEGSNVRVALFLAPVEDPRP